MAFNVNFYNFQKETNSTAVPEPVSGDTQKVVYPCVAIDPLSLAAPVIKVLIPMDADINFNYMFVGSFNRYYWMGFRQGRSSGYIPISNWRDFGLCAAQCARIRWHGTG